MLIPTFLRASPPTLSLWPCKNISHIQVLVANFFPTPEIKLKLGLQVGGRLLLATHLDQSNSVTNQKQGAVNKSNLNLFIRRYRAPRGSQRYAFFQGPSSLPLVSQDFIQEIQWTSSNISSAGSHTNCWWKCSQCGARVNQPITNRLPMTEHFGRSFSFFLHFEWFKML